MNTPSDTKHRYVAKDSVCMCVCICLPLVAKHQPPNSSVDEGPQMNSLSVFLDQVWTKLVHNTFVLRLSSRFQWSRPPSPRTDRSQEAQIGFASPLPRHEEVHASDLFAHP